MARHGNQVHMVGHQAIAKNADRDIAKAFLQKSQIRRSILVTGEDLATIHTSLGDVPRQLR